MQTNKLLISVGVMLTLWCAQSLSAEGSKYALRERCQSGQQWQVQMQTRVEVEAKPAGTKMLVSAQHRFWEHVLAVADAANPQNVAVGVRPGLPVRIARYYEEADWQRQPLQPVQVSSLAAATEKRHLREDRKFLVAWRWRDDTLVFSPNGPLSREELDLTQGHLDVLMVPNLLPDGLVAVDETWTVPIPIAQALCGLDGVTEARVQARLASVQNDQAVIVIEGKVEGITDGCETVNTVQGTLHYDLTFERWTQLRWRQTQQRQAGPINPALQLVAEVQVSRVFAGRSAQLSPAVLQNVPAEPTAAYLLLSYRAPRGECEFYYDRGWHRVAQEERFVVFRLLDRGELVAQMNVTFWPKAKPGEHLSPEQIREFADKAPSFQPEKVIESGEIKTPDGRWIYRHTVQGKSEELPIVLTWYVVADSQGHQVVFVFTTEPALADKLGGRDLAIVQSVSFPQP